MRYKDVPPFQRVAMSAKGEFTSPSAVAESLKDETFWMKTSLETILFKNFCNYSGIDYFQSKLTKKT